MAILETILSGCGSLMPVLSDSKNDVFLLRKRTNGFLSTKSTEILSKELFGIVLSPQAFQTAD